jgi:preprotein translocase subunit SecD
MKVWTLHFNIILLLLALASGCQTGRPAREISAIRFHMEVNADGPEAGKSVPVYRAMPVEVTVDPAPFLDERDVEQASVVDWMDGFAIQIRFTRHGAMILENTTRRSPNRRIAVCGEFGATRWLAAPLVGRPIADGTFSFTPDCTREEADRLVLGLNTVANEVKKLNK